MSVPWYLMAKGKGGGGYKTASGPIVSVSDALAAPLRSLRIGIDPVQEGTGDPSPDNVRPISGWSAANVWVKPTYDPTANPTATIQLGDTIYGGTLDVINGVLTVDRAEVDLGTLSWSPWGAVEGLYGAEISDMKAPTTAEERKTDILCSMYPVATAATINNNFTDKSCARYQQNVMVRDTSYATAAALTTALDGVSFVYPLATPITIPLTATQISTLAGQNVLWADSGDVTLEYLAAGGTDPDLMKLAVAFMGKR